MVRRWRQKIVVRIEFLRYCSGTDRIKKPIIEECNLNTKSFAKHVEWGKRYGLLMSSSVDGQVTYRATTKGENYLKALDELNNIASFE